MVTKKDPAWVVVSDTLRGFGYVLVSFIASEAIGHIRITLLALRTALITQLALGMYFFNHERLASGTCSGVGILALGVVLMILSRRVLRQTASPTRSEDWRNMQVVVDKGAYAFVRHPMYLGWILASFGLLLVSQHWLSLILAVFPLIIFSSMIIVEEDLNLKKFGISYADYMDQVPMVNVLCGCVRFLRRKNRTRFICRTEDSHRP